MTEEKTLSCDAWDGFLGSSVFLKAEEVESDQVFVCVDVEISDDGRPRLSLQSGGNETKTFDLNVTNANIISEMGITAPKECIGKKFTFRKVTVISPKTKKEVEALRVKKIE